MRDYLWDKTGEPDAEVERLEALLGDFGHAPRPLELPAGAAPSLRRPSLFLLPGRLGASRLFSPAGLAAAAALLLASLLCAAALLRARVATEERGDAARVTRQGVRRETPPDAPAHARAGGVGDSKAGVVDAARGSDGVSKDERVVVKDLGRGPHVRRGAAPAPAAWRRQRLTQTARVDPRPGASRASESTVAGVGAASLFEGTRLLAKEQLVYALRLTGAKLRDVRQKTRGREESEPHAGARAPVK